MCLAENTLSLGMKDDKQRLFVKAFDCSESNQIRGSRFQNEDRIGRINDKSASDLMPT